MAPDGPGKKPDELARAFVSHPRKELLQTHNPQKFGCSSCHGGNGRATTSVVKGHGRHKYWLYPDVSRKKIPRPVARCATRMIA